MSTPTPTPKPASGPGAGTPPTSKMPSAAGQDKPKTPTLETPPSSKDALKKQRALSDDQPSRRADGSATSDETPARSTDRLDSQKPPAGGEDEARKPSKADRAKEGAKGAAEAGATQALDKAGGAGTTKDLKALTGKNEDGSATDKSEKAVAAAKLAGRAAAAYGGVAEQAGTAIDKTGDALNKGIKKAKKVGREYSGKELLDNATAPEGRNQESGRAQARQDPGKSKQTTQNTPTSASAPAQQRKASGMFTGKGKTSSIVAGLAVAALLLVTVFTGIFLGDDDTPGQPDDKSDQQAQQWVAGSWQDVLRDAASRVHFAGSPSEIPWTVLAGIAAEQTTFGRYSPYDAIDRDPNSTLTDILATNVSNRSDVAGGPVVKSPQGAGSIQEFVDIYAKTFKKVLSKYDLPYDAVLAQAALESGLGKSSLTQAANNFFGIKFNSHCGPDYVIFDTKEYDSSAGQYKTISAKWCSWQTPSDSVEAYAQMIHRVYPAALAYPNDGVAYIRAVAAGGYATDPEYADKVARSIAQVRTELRAIGMDVPGGGVSNPTADDASSDGLAFNNTDTVVAEPVSGPNDDCEVPDPDPAIGGEGDEGVGPFLLTPSAAESARHDGYDPQSACVAQWIAEKLGDTVPQVRDLDDSDWNALAPYDPDDTDAMDKFDTDVTFWQRVVDMSDLFVGKNAGKSSCVLPGEVDLKPGKKAYKQYTTQIAYSFHCALSQQSDLYSVSNASWTTPSADATDGQILKFKPEPKLTLYSDRSTAESAIINEALQVSFLATKWDLTTCSASSDDAQGLIPLTPKEATSAGLDPNERCNPGKSAAAAAVLFAKGEAVPLSDRPTKDGPFQPAFGGWDNIGIALGTKDRDEFAQYATGTSPQMTDKCLADTTTFVNKLADFDDSYRSKKDGDTGKRNLGFGDLRTSYRPSPEQQEKNLDAGRNEIKASGLTPPWTNKDCAPARDVDYAESLGELVVDMRAAATTPQDRARKTAFDGIIHWAEMLGARDGGTYLVGRSSLVAPRLSVFSYDYPSPPVNVTELAEQALQQAGAQGDNASLGQRSAEYAVFFGGVSQPFDSVGVLYGSLLESAHASSSSFNYANAVKQTSVGPDGCPTTLPAIALNDSKARQYDVEKLCEDSVADARSPEAAEAIKWAMSKAGTWQYSQDYRNLDGYADCSSLVSRAYEEGAGLRLYTPGTNPWTTATFRTVNANHPEIPIDDLQPGDWFQPTSGHVYMVLAHGLMVHAPTFGRPVQIQSFYTRDYNHGGYIDPSKFSRLPGSDTQS